MKKVLPLCLLLGLALPAVAVEDGQVMYIGGTVSILKQGAIGKLDTSSQTELIFESEGNRLTIPYDQMDSYEYTQPVARHLGVLPAIAVGLLKARQHKHVFRFTYHEQGAAPQVAIFEVSKQAPRSLLAILQARAPQRCKLRPSRHCGNSSRANSPI